REALGAAAAQARACRGVTGRPDRAAGLTGGDGAHEPPVRSRNAGGAAAALVLELALVAGSDAAPGVRGPVASGAVRRVAAEAARNARAVLLAHGLLTVTAIL